MKRPSQTWDCTEGMCANDCDNLKSKCTKCSWKGGLHDCHTDAVGMPLCPECNEEVIQDI